MTSHPRAAHIIAEIEPQIGRINYVECLTQWVKFHICIISGVVWVIGEIYKSRAEYANGNNQRISPPSQGLNFKDVYYLW